MQCMDGSRIKEFVENDATFNEYVEKKFNALDCNHDGRLTEVELEPMVQSLADALGIPPVGSSPETDHMYKEVFSEFRCGDAGGVTQDVFGMVLKDILLGLAAGLERDPISIISFDGTALLEYARSSKFEADTFSIFTRIDAKSEGYVQANRLVGALPTSSIVKGMPAVTDPKMKGLIEYGFHAARVDTGRSLDQMQFVDCLRRVSLAMAEALQQHPLKVANSEKIFDGKSVQKLIKNEELLRKALDETWQLLPKNNRHQASKNYLRVGLDEISPAAGLPPVGAVDEIDEVLQSVFEKFDLDKGGNISQEEFEKCMMQVLGSLMLQLEGKPVMICINKIVEE